jgi:ABC-type transport system involved in multi-copper enzyme maturation permease subunit
MTSATVSRGVVHPIRRSRIASFRWLLRAEWTKLWSVRSTAWSLGILVVAAIGVDTALTAATIASWRSVSAASRSIYLADPTGFLSAVLAFAGIPICVLGVMVISSEYSTGMIQASILAVPRRIPMLAAKAAMFATVTFVISEIVGFSSFFIGQAIIHSHVPVSLHDPGVLRAVFGVGLYLTVLGLLGLAIGALVRHTGAALTVAIGLVIVLSNLARILPGSLGTHVAAYLPTNAGVLITHAHQEAADLLSPWQGFGVFCLWAALLFGAAIFLLNRRDA